MSYVSGFMMGAAIGKGLRQMFAGAPARTEQAGRKALAAGKRTVKSGVQKGVQKLAGEKALQLVASLPGRRRYRAKAISPELAILLEVKLGELGYIKTVSVSATTGSILLTFDPSAADRVDRLAFWLEINIFSAVRSGNFLDERHAGAVTRSIRHSARNLSSWMKDHTGGTLDLSALAAVIFMIRGMRKMLMYNQNPSGPQMLWWALSLLRGWRTV